MRYHIQPPVVETRALGSAQWCEITSLGTYSYEIRSDPNATVPAPEGLYRLEPRLVHHPGGGLTTVVFSQTLEIKHAEETGKFWAAQKARSAKREAKPPVAPGQTISPDAAARADGAVQENPLPCTDQPNCAAAAELAKPEEKPQSRKSVTGHGRIKTWSSASQHRAWRKVASIDFDQIRETDALWITLTFPPGVALHPEETSLRIERFIDKVQKSAHRKHLRVGIISRIEQTRKGMPHVHMLLYFPDGTNDKTAMARREARYRKQWIRLNGDESQAFARQGLFCRVPENHEHLQRAAFYMLKNDREDRLGEGYGRRFRTRGFDCFPSECHSLRIPPELALPLAAAILHDTGESIHSLKHLGRLTRIMKTPRLNQRLDEFGLKPFPERSSPLVLPTQITTPPPIPYPRFPLPNTAFIRVNYAGDAVVTIDTLESQPPALSCFPSLLSTTTRPPDHTHTRDPAKIPSNAPPRSASPLTSLSSGLPRLEPAATQCLATTHSLYGRAQPQQTQSVDPPPTISTQFQEAKAPSGTFEARNPDPASAAPENAARAFTTAPRPQQPPAGGAILTSALSHPCLDGNAGGRP